MANFRHNKLRNAGLLFEFLLRQVTVDVLDKKEDSNALKIIKTKTLLLMLIVQLFNWF
jgi:hypothetical protein